MPTTKAKPAHTIATEAGGRLSLRQSALTCCSPIRRYRGEPTPG
jgi:hypothetical protein